MFSPSRILGGERLPGCGMLKGENSMIRTEGLTKRFDQLTAVHNLNIHVEPGEMYGFLGPNGAGKTTTIMMLLGLTRPTEGRITLFGKDLASDYFEIKSRIGVLAEFQFLYEEMTAKEYLKFFCELYRVDDPDRRINHCLELVNLWNRRDELLRGYSKGMKQKLGLARALLHDPDVLILDEPVSSLDPHGIKEVRDILMSENEKGKTMFISSHILSEIERTCHRVGIIHKGRLMAEDTMDNLKRKVMDEVQLTVELESPVEAVTVAIKGLPFVLSVQLEGARYTIKTRSDQDYRAQVSKAIATAGGILLDMRRHEMTLEEAFVTITERDIQLLAEEGSAA